MVKKSKRQTVREEKGRYSPVFDTLVYAILVAVLLLTLVTVMYVVAVSFTPYSEVV